MFEELTKEFEKKYPKGYWSITKRIASKKDLKERGPYDAYVSSDLEIGAPTFFSALESGFTISEAFSDAVTIMEAKKKAFDEQKKTKAK